MLVGWCYLCWWSKETVDHLLLHYTAVFNLWGFTFRSFGILWVPLEKTLDLFFGWKNWFGKHSSDIWNLVLLCLMWSIWREQNCYMFDDAKSTRPQLLDMFIGTIFDWSRAWGFTNCNCILDFVQSLPFYTKYCSFVIL